MANSGCFKKGHVPHNKDKKLEDYLSEEKIKKINQTTFKPGQRAGDKNNTWKGGIQVCKSDCVYLYDGVNKRIRRPKVVYEKVHGPIPAGWILFHIDGEKHNDDIDNLIAVPRAVLMKLNSGRLNRNWHEIEAEVRIYLETKKEGTEVF